MGKPVGYFHTLVVCLPFEKALSQYLLSTLMFNHGRHYGLFFYLEPLFIQPLIWSSNLARIAPSVVAHLSTRKSLWRRSGVKSLTSIICTRAAVSNRLRARMTIGASDRSCGMSPRFERKHTFLRLEHSHSITKNVNAYQWTFVPCARRKKISTNLTSSVHDKNAKTHVKAVKSRLVSNREDKTIRTDTHCWIVTETEKVY